MLSCTDISKVTNRRTDDDHTFLHLEAHLTGSSFDRNQAYIPYMNEPCTCNGHVHPHLSYARSRSHLAGTRGPRPNNIITTRDERKASPRCIREAQEVRYGIE